MENRDDCLVREVFGDGLGLFVDQSLWNLIYKMLSFVRIIKNREESLVREVLKIEHLGSIQWIDQKIILKILPTNIFIQTIYIIYPLPSMVMGFMAHFVRQADQRSAAAEGRNGW
jgi:hypothetical protein